MSPNSIQFGRNVRKHRATGIMLNPRLAEVMLPWAAEPRPLPKRRPGSIREFLCAFVVTLFLFFSAIRTKNDSFSGVDVNSVASRLMQASDAPEATTGRPFRSPLRRVLSRRPVAFFKYSDRQDLGLFNVGVVIEELLECGHIVTKYAGDDEPLIAVRRRCAECKEAAGIHEVLPEKKPAQKAIPFPNKEDKSA